jgi:tetratricopeptide (TPR) repeat protein
MAEVEDARQNLWRWAGDLDHAAAAAEEWDAAAGHKDFLPLIRLGETQYLQARYDAAAATFEAATRRAQTGYVMSFDLALARLARGAALLAGGRSDEGITLLRLLCTDLDRAEAEFRLGTFDKANKAVARRYAVFSYQADLQLGDALRRSGQTSAALEYYSAAQERLPLAGFETMVFPGVLYNNEALALMTVNRADSAQAAADRAISTDRANPIFLLTAASAAQQAGAIDRARELNAAVLKQDPTAFSAANNLAVQEATMGKLQNASRALRRAVGARDDYAVGWFNLGVVNSHRGLGFLLISQGAFARAIALDPGLADHSHELILDEHVYRTDLDLSKTLPAGWSLGSVEHRQPLLAVGLLSVAGLVVGLAKAATGSGARMSSWFKVGAQTITRFRLLGRRRHPAWAIAATLAAFAFPVALRSDAGWVADVIYIAFLLLLIGTVLVLRWAVAVRSSVRIVQRTWPPGIVIGVLGGIIGTPWAPLPYLRAPARASRLHFVAPVALAAVSLLMLFESALWPVPLVRGLAISGLVMTASVLLPIPPLDGEHLGRAGVFVGLSALAGVLLVLLDIV